MAAAASPSRLAILVVFFTRVAYHKTMTVDITQSRERILDFLGTHKVGVLATADATGKPHAAAVYVVCDPQLVFYFITKKATRKSTNLSVNSQAALAVYDEQSQTTVQVDGQVEVVTDPAQIDRIFTEIQAIARLTSQSGTPPPAKLLADGYVVYRLSSPTARLASYSDTPATDQHDIFEIVT